MCASIRVRPVTTQVIERAVRVVREHGAPTAGGLACGRRPQPAPCHARGVREPPIADRLRTIVGADHVLTDADLRAGFEQDWTGRYRGSCTAVVRPGTTDEVASVVAACNDARVAVVPQAGNTGLVGGGVPRAHHERSVVVLSLHRLDHIVDVDVDALQLTAGAGVTIGAWQAAARSVGLDAPLDFAARDAATIGGAIATNAGGSRVLRFGTMRRQVVGIRAVLADGRVVGSLSGLPKETVGLHWPSVLTGSEGTLAVVTAARLRLVPRFAEVATALVSMATRTAAVELAGMLRSKLGSLDSLELIEPPALRLVAHHLGVPAPVEVRDRGTVVLVECADHRDPSRELADALAGLDGVVDSAFAVDPGPRDHLIAFRDRITESIGAATGTPPFKLDVAVPIGSIDTLVHLAHRAADADGAELIPFGHLAEGNVHLNFLGARRPETIATTVLAAVAELGGTISAEHGIGTAKTAWLRLVRSQDDLAAQRAIRRALDPNRILNPGVLEPPDDQVP